MTNNLIILCKTKVMFLKTINRLTMISKGIDFEDDINLQTMTANRFISSCINKKYPVTRYIISNIYFYIKNYRATQKIITFEEFMEYNL